ncbi:DUF3037 domain-containing protein [Longimicrobium sp.]|uniref:DUF3037 domain-containing protein n=1 Tax=Longimicrobium sp. TaxID=2029185 RepID=UPI002E313E76|nr:DUF3037 domain-containing protein [Longimicrobium sp.]HEX6036770.1 DUF3037 domain-containing protein [Longimicrobium sp.]
MTDAASARWIAYSFAVLCVVPHPHLGTAVPVGVMVHARTADFLGIRVVTDPAELAARVPGVDVELLARYLRDIRAIAEGDAEAGPVALVPPSERFHWLTAPRSDVIQSGPVHGGLCHDPQTALERLFASHVGVFA